MSLESNALTTLATLRTWLNAESSDDAILERLINVASSRIESITGRLFAKQVHAEKHSGHDMQELWLQQYPIITQGVYPTVTVDDAAWTIGAANDFEVVENANTDEHYLFAEATWPSSQYYRDDTLCPSDPDPDMRDLNISVTNLAGYVTPEFASRAVSGTIAAGSSKTVTVANTTCLAVGDTATLTSTGATGVSAASESVTISAIPSSTTVTLTTVANAHAGTITLAVTRNLPHDLEDCCIELAEFLWNRRGKAGIKTEGTTGGYRVEMTDDIPAELHRSIRKHRRPAL